MTPPRKFTYPFCYVPHPLVVEAAEALIGSLERSSLPEGVMDALRSGKMLGVLITDRGPLYAFSGLLDGKSTIEGFVPAIFDLTPADGYFRTREAEISAMHEGPAKAMASAQLQDWLFDRYIVMNGRGEELSIKEVFALRGIVPPGGTGDCAAPKLLNHAFRIGAKPLAMGEFWYGASPRKEVREQARFYPSCTGKCGPLLSWMMLGLDVEDSPLDGCFNTSDEPAVIFEDEHIIVIDKPSGLLSVPGRTPAPSLLGWLREKYGESIESCHRLDMDTSGLMVFAKTLADKVEMERQFASREVHKTYRARLVGGPWKRARKGTVALPLMLDYYDRPRQMVDYDDGKKAVTEYEVLDILPNGEIDVRFSPLTGRSHQLRVHAAHASGLGHPIKGDRLYGSAEAGERLWLRADSLEFTHPASGEKMAFKL